ncbi:uncharacterized protein TNCT_207871 [Trichonephila clavata]|uniref:BTB domain-containing protein n=1 Tax=Trichonephila clavata TaxID=2740835 RepID=A0A8X6L901_TRICU|nr:uncharacterized protein TNCT_207871 [Trichonephila clavata]
MSFKDVIGGSRKAEILECYAYLQPRRTYYPRLFKVIVHPNGTRNGNKDYISVEIRKDLKDADPIQRYSYDIITWTLSIIDVRGVGKYYQSFTKENIVHFPYKIEIVFLKRSILLEQADEFLAGDALTIRCEAFFLSYPGPAIEKNCKHLRSWVLEDYSHRYKKKSNDIKPYQRNYYKNITEKGENNLIQKMYALLKTLQGIKNNTISSESLKYWKNTLIKDIDSDELFSTYLSSNPIFQTYCRIKRKLMRKLDMVPEHQSVYQRLESEISIPWIETRQQLRRMLKSHSKEQNMRSVNGEQNLEIDDEQKVLFEFIEYELRNDEECTPRNVTECNNDDKWSFFVETCDNITFTLLFEKDKKTIGSKLLAASPVFENMLNNPMKERFCKRVTLADMDSKTFLNMLYCIQWNDMQDPSFKSVCDLYEAADKYQYIDLMHVCATFMTPFFDMENIDTVQMLSYLHSDKYLQQMVEIFINQNMSDRELGENKGNWDLCGTKVEKESFDFYH